MHVAGMQRSAGAPGKATGAPRRACGRTDRSCIIDVRPVRRAPAVTLDFLLTALVVVLLPGTGVLYTVSTGLAHGARASVAAAIGCTLGIVPHLLASALGLAALLHASAVAFQLVKLAGVLWLLWLAWTMWREAADARRPAFDAAPATPGLVRIAVRGTLINVLNPKLSLFFLAFLPQFVPAGEGDALARLALLSATFMAMTLVVFVLYGLLAHAVRARLAGSPRLVPLLQRGFALVFVWLGVRLATAER